MGNGHEIERGRDKSRLFNPSFSNLKRIKSNPRLSRLNSPLNSRLNSGLCTAIKFRIKYGELNRLKSGADKIRRFSNFFNENRRTR
jgi:hypothetical protein